MNITYVNASVNDWDFIDQALYDVETYYLWVIFALGFPGNSATIFTVIKMAPARSLTVYIALLGLVDNLAIITKLLIFVLLDHDVAIGNFGCKLLGYLGNFLITFGNWLLVGMSVERFVAVWFPLKIGQTLTFKKSLVITAVASLPVFCLFLHLFWAIKFSKDEEDGFMFCDIYEEYKYFMIHVWFWINILAFAVLPCCLLIFFNTLIVLGIVKSDRRRIILRGKQKVGNVERNRQVTLMLVTAAATLVVLTTPRCIMLILTPYWLPEEGSKEATVHYLIDTIAHILCDSTHAVNFYVYSLSAKRFRRYFVTLIMCRDRKDTKLVSDFGTSSRFAETFNMRSSQTWFRESVYNVESLRKRFSFGRKGSSML